MIPAEVIGAWRATVPWSFDEQVEHDLVLSRAMIEIFIDPFLEQRLALRGGTALHKLYFEPPGRFSEDIDLVQVNAEPIGETVDHLRATLDPWLGEPVKRRMNYRMVHLIYQFETTLAPRTLRKLKLEIHCREHLAFDGHTGRHHAIVTPWFSGGANIRTFSLDELLGTKLRALVSRNAGRDAFDLDRAQQLASPPDVARVVQHFTAYLRHENRRLTRAQFEEQMDNRARDPAFVDDMKGLLATAAGPYDCIAGLRRVEAAIVPHLEGAPWAGRC